MVKRKENILNEDRLRNLWDKNKHINTCIYRRLKRRREKRVKNLSEEIMAEKFPDEGKKTDIQVPRGLQRRSQGRPQQDIYRLKCQRLKRESEKQQEKNN